MRGSLILVGAVVLGSGCYGSSPGMVTPEVDAGLGTPDGAAPADAGAPEADGGPVCNAPPTRNFGTQVGRSFTGLTLPACDGSTFDFYGPSYCEARATVFVINAAWCNPSNIEADLLGAFADTYAARGVRVVEVIIQDESYRLPTATWCESWIERHHLGAHNIELLDPEGRTQIYNPTEVIPSHTIVDAHGIIRFRSTGLSEAATPGGYDISELTAALDAVLAEP